MKKKSESGQLGDTAQERQLADMALQRYSQYKQKWQPVQQQAIAMVNKMGQAGSMERERAKTQSVGAVGAEFDEAAGQVDDAYANRGVGINSGSAKMGMEKVQTARAGTQGIAAAGAESDIDRAYVEGLTQIMATGSNQAEQAMSSGAQSAATAINDQAMRMKAKASRRAGIAKFVGQGIGAAGAAFGSMPAAGAGSGSGFGFSGANQAAPYTPGVDI